MKTVKEVSYELKLTEKTIRNWIKSGKINAVKIQSRVRITEEEVERIKRGE